MTAVDFKKDVYISQQPTTCGVLLTSMKNCNTYVLFYHLICDETIPVPPAAETTPKSLSENDAPYEVPSHGAAHGKSIIANYPDKTNDEFDAGDSFSDVDIKESDTIRGKPPAAVSTQDGFDAGQPLAATDTQDEFDAGDSLSNIESPDPDSINAKPPATANAQDEFDAGDSFSDMKSPESNTIKGKPPAASDAHDKICVGDSFHAESLGSIGSLSFDDRSRLIARIHELESQTEYVLHALRLSTK